MRGVRTAQVMQQGVRKIHDVWKDSDDIRVTDRSLIWNTDLVETLEFDNRSRRPRSPWPER